MFNGILYFRKKYLSLDKIRKLVEKCSSFQGFLFFNSDEAEQVQDSFLY